MFEMKDIIYIIGAGAIGKALAVFLQLKGEEVILIRGTIDGEPAHEENLQVLLPDGTNRSAAIRVDTLSNLNHLDGTVVLTNKSYGNAQLAEKLITKARQRPIILLQNGLSIEQPFLDANYTEIYRCVLFATSQQIDQTTIRFKPVAPSAIGVIKSAGSQLSTIVEQLSSTDFPFRQEPDIQPVIWKKAITNAVFNSVCPLLNVDNGIFQRNEAALTIGHRVIKECTAVANALDVKLRPEDVVASLLLISRLSDGQLISTLQDINNKRQTEIETLNFEIVRLAENLGMVHLIQETRLLGELTRLKSDISRG